MRKVWKHDDKPVLETIYCKGRVNRPQLNHLICEANCKKYKDIRKCPDYAEWYLKHHGKEKELESPAPKNKKIRRKKR